MAKRKLSRRKLVEDAKKKAQKEQKEQELDNMEYKKDISSEELQKTIMIAKRAVDKKPELVKELETKAENIIRESDPAELQHIEFIGNESAKALAGKSMDEMIEEKNIDLLKNCALKTIVRTRQAMRNESMDDINGLAKLAQVPSGAVKIDTAILEKIKGNYDQEISPMTDEEKNELLEEAEKRQEEMQMKARQKQEEINKKKQEKEIRAQKKQKKRSEAKKLVTNWKKQVSKIANKQEMQQSKVQNILYDIEGDAEKESAANILDESDKELEKLKTGSLEEIQNKLAELHDSLTNTKAVPTNKALDEISDKISTLHESLDSTDEAIANAVKQIKSIDDERNKPKEKKEVTVLFEGNKATLDGEPVAYVHDSWIGRNVLKYSKDEPVKVPMFIDGMQGNYKKVVPNKRKYERPTKKTEAVFINFANTGAFYNEEMDKPIMVSRMPKEGKRDGELYVEDFKQNPELVGTWKVEILFETKRYYKGKPVEQIRSRDANTERRIQRKLFKEFYGINREEFKGTYEVVNIDGRKFVNIVNTSAIPEDAVAGQDYFIEGFWDIQYADTNRGPVTFEVKYIRFKKYEDKKNNREIIKPIPVIAEKKGRRKNN